MLQRSLKGSRHGPAHEVLGFCKSLFDGVEVRTIGWKKEEMRARLPDRLADLFVFVAAQIVDYNDIAGLEGLNELRLDIDCEGLAIDGAVKHPRRLNAVVAQRGDKGHGFPAAIGNRCPQPLAARPPAT